jgi:O-antigen ligase
MFLLFSGWFAASALLALDAPRATAELPALVKLILPICVGVTMIKSGRECWPILWTMVLAQGYVAFEMHVEYLFRGINGPHRGFGGYDNNFFGASLVVVVGPAIALMISSRTWWARCAAGISAALIVHTILLTFSRGAMVGLFAAGLTAFVMMPKRPRYLAALLVILLVTARFTGPELYARYASTFAPVEERDNSAQTRVDLWRDCLLVVGQYPMFGVGPANWRIIADRYGWTEGKSAHSVWMEMAAEIGLPGALGLLLFFLIPAVRLWPIARTPMTEANRQEVILASGIVLSMVGWIASAQFVSAGGLEAPYYVAMLGAAVLKSTVRKTAPAAARLVSPPPMPLAAVQSLRQSTAAQSGPARAVSRVPGPPAIPGLRRSADVVDVQDV